MNKYKTPYNKNTGLLYEGRQEGPDTFLPSKFELWYSICPDHIIAEQDKLNAILMAEGYDTYYLKLWATALDVKHAEMMSRAKQHGIKVQISQSIEAEDPDDWDNLIFGFDNQNDAFFFKLLF